MARNPHDYNQCQAIRPNKTWSPFNLGPASTINGHKVGGSVYRDRTYRCPEKPAFIVQENEAGKDGIRGTMSVCGDCFVVLCLQAGGTFEVIEDVRSDEDKEASDMARAVGLLGPPDQKPSPVDGA